MMVQFFHTLDLAAAPDIVFSFFLASGNHLKMIPPDLAADLIEAPAILVQGACLTWKVRRWGLTRRIISEVTLLSENRVLVEEQKEGPLPSWVHTRRFADLAQGTRLHDQIEFEPARGMLGRVLTVAAITSDLEKGFAFRDEVLKATFGVHPEPC